MNILFISFIKVIAYIIFISSLNGQPLQNGFQMNLKVGIDLSINNMIQQTHNSILKIKYMTISKNLSFIRFNYRRS